MPLSDEMNVELLDKADTDKKNETTQKIISSVFGAIPYIGPAVSEIINSYIPDNRRERVVAFIKELVLIVEQQGKQISELQEWLERIKTNKKSLLLLETALLNSMQTESQIKLHSYAYYVFNFVDNTQISDIQKEAILNTLSKLNEVEILHIISLEQDKFIFEESDFHKKYGEYVDRHTACGDEEDELFNAMQDSYLNNLVVYGIATCTGDPKKGQASFKLLPYGQVIYESIFDEKFFQ
ncbi:MAG: hypothetical protein MSH22_05100 [Spirochaetia bacterium]|nr:hypothetical protein [Spirochaetia bacterium]